MILRQLHVGRNSGVENLWRPLLHPNLHELWWRTPPALSWCDPQWPKLLSLDKFRRVKTPPPGCSNAVLLRWLGQKQSGYVLGHLSLGHRTIDGQSSCGSQGSHCGTCTSSTKG